MVTHLIGLVLAVVILVAGAWGIKTLVDILRLEEPRDDD